jgi:hypothetical protein
VCSGLVVGGKVDANSVGFFFGMMFAVDRNRSRAEEKGCRLFTAGLLTDDSYSLERRDVRVYRAIHRAQLLSH